VSTEVLLVHILAGVLLDFFFRLVEEFLTGSWVKKKAQEILTGLISSKKKRVLLGVILFASCFVRFFREQLLLKIETLCTRFEKDFLILILFDFLYPFGGFFMVFRVLTAFLGGDEIALSSCILELIVFVFFSSLILKCINRVIELIKRMHPVRKRRKLTWGRIVKWVVNVLIFVGGILLFF
jgi:hypothetical protein